jgi:two-component sensor histidine kinase/CheY-like chemotaxis protein
MANSVRTDDVDHSSPTQAAPKARILIVDDDRSTSLALTAALERLGQTLVVAFSGEEALQKLLHEDFAVILLDLHMSGMDGYETAALIRARKKTRHIPIVFLTAVFRDDSHLLQAYSAGAVDMIFKPVDPFILTSKISVFVDLYLKQFEAQREAEIRHKLQEENFRVRAEKISAEQALRRSQEHQEAMSAAEAQQRILIEELSHRVKNMLAVVNAMARQTLASTPEPEAFVEKFLKRIEALGRTHGLLSREQWGNVQLRDVASEALEPYIMDDKTRVVLHGPPVAIQPKAAVALGIVFHELATNAVKHGCLSNNDGVVTVQWDWHREENGSVALEWGESKGPKVKAPTRNGFGSRLIKLELTHELSGNVEMAYDEAGFRAVLTFPTTPRIGSIPPPQAEAASA